MKDKWIKVKFGEIVQNITDRIDKPSESGLDFYIGLDQLDTDQIRIKRFASTSDVEATKFLCKKGDIIFGKRNAYLRKVAVSDRDAVVSAHSMVLRPFGELIDLKFLPCLLQSSTFWKIAHAISEGSMSPTIKWKILSKQEFKIPSIVEQKRIAELLWAIEDNIEKTEKMIEANEELKKGLLNELLTKGIEHKKFKKTEIGEIPEDWDVVKISDLCNVRRGASPRPINNKDYFSEEGFGWIRIRDVTPIYKYLRKTEQKLSELGVSKSVKVKKGDLIMSICATIGKPIIIDMNACIHDGFVLFSELDKKRISTEFLFYVLLKNKEEFLSSKQVGTQGNLNTGIVGGISIGLPINILEQQRIVSIFNKIETFEIAYEVIQENLFKLKKKLTDELISGKIQLK